MEKDLKEAKKRIKAVKEEKLNKIAKHIESQQQLASLTQLNREKLELEHSHRMRELT